MDPRIAKLTTPEDCESFARNALTKAQPELAIQAHKRAVQLAAAKHGAASDVERQCIEAVFAYERVLSARNRRRTRASRTWQMIARHGVIEAVERIVTRREDALGYTALVEAGLHEFAFEAVVLRNPASFSAEAVAQSKLRLGESRA